VGLVRPWLEPYPWEFVTAQNALLCHAKNALHKPTSDGHDRTRELWQANHTRPMLLEEAVEPRDCERARHLTPTLSPIEAERVKNPRPPDQWGDAAFGRSAHRIRILAG
jgi:hypothetical protein